MTWLYHGSIILLQIWVSSCFSRCFTKTFHGVLGVILPWPESFIMKNNTVLLKVFVSRETIDKFRFVTLCFDYVSLSVVFVSFYVTAYARTSYWHLSHLPRSRMFLLFNIPIISNCATPLKMYHIGMSYLMCQPLLCPPLSVLIQKNMHNAYVRLEAFIIKILYSADLKPFRNVGCLRFLLSS